MKYNNNQIYMYLVEHNNLCIALVAISFGRYDHHQASAIQNLKRLFISVINQLDAQTLGGRLVHRLRGDWLECIPTSPLSTCAPDGYL